MAESDFKPDDAVVVVSGPFKGYHGVVIGYDQTAPSRVEIEVVDALGRMATASVEAGEIKRR